MTLGLLLLGDRIIGGRSAYSKINFELATRWAELGHRVAHIPMSRANRMGNQTLHNVLVYNSGNHPWGEDVAVPRYIDFKADMLITNKEPWIFENLHKIAINFVPLAIIDHAPVSWSIVTKLYNAFKIIAISRFGQRELKKRNMDSTYIPNGVRTDIYKPMDKTKCKKQWYFEEDEFIVGMVQMNRARKLIPHQLRGYQRFRENNPDVKSKLMLWTNIRPSRPPEDTSIGVADVGIYLLP